MKTFNNDPNFSIVLPGGCNAKCGFCFNKTQPRIPSSPIREYLFNLNAWLSSIGPQFYQVSLTGGEPMLSPYLDAVLGLLAGKREKYTNIILTTNGTGLLAKIDLVSAAVDHINISRHHFDEKANTEVFGGSYNMPDAELSEIIDRFGERGIDVSINCVINDSTPKDFILDFIAWANRTGVNAIRFRKENGDLSPTPVEREFASYKVLWEGSCPVCRTTLQKIKGMDVYWKSSTLEPSEVITESVFEIVYQPNGMAYLDWQGKIPLRMHLDVAPRASERGAGRSLCHPSKGESCGRSGSGCGGSNSSCGSRGSSDRC